MLKHQGTTQLETQRLILRRFTVEDAETAFHRWTSDGEVCKYMRWQKHSTVEETAQVLARWAENYSKESFYLWAITLKGQSEPVGSISLFVENEGDECGDVAYCIGRGYWGQGIVTEALKAVLGFAFSAIGFNRIETYHAVKNPASGRVMQKAGMRYEGLARQKYKSNMGFEDSALYAILREDHPSGCGIGSL